MGEGKKGEGGKEDLSISYGMQIHKSQVSGMQSQVSL